MLVDDRERARWRSAWNEVELTRPSAFVPFAERLAREFLPAFCGVRGFSEEGFVATALERLHPLDANDFLGAIGDGRRDQGDLIGGDAAAVERANHGPQQVLEASFQSIDRGHTGG